MLDLGDRCRTVAEYPHAAVALMHELTPNAGGERATSTPGTIALTSASVELGLTVVCRLVFEAIAAPLRKFITSEATLAPVCGKSTSKAPMGLLRWPYDCPSTASLP